MKIPNQSVGFGRSYNPQSVQAAVAPSSIVEVIVGKLIDILIGDGKGGDGKGQCGQCGCKGACSMDKDGACRCNE